MQLLENGLYQAESSGSFVIIYIIGDFSKIEYMCWPDLLRFKYKKTFKI